MDTEIILFMCVIVYATLFFFQNVEIKRLKRQLEEKDKLIEMLKNK
jgi:hypothetical protein